MGKHDWGVLIGEEIWDSHVVCSCGWYVSRLDVQSVMWDYPICPKCGRGYGCYQRVIRKWRSQAIWWKPWTWLRGTWEVTE